MKKSTKVIRLSVTLLLLIAMLLTPMSPIFAVIIDGSGGADLTAADIVSEDASKREQFSRHFLTGDGTYFAVSYAEQVNYQDEDGNWIAVDNSLSTNVLTGEKTTKNDKFKVKFANKANKDDLVTIKTKEYDVSFGITVSEDGENYLALNKVKGTESASNTSAEPKTTQEATSLGKAVSGITYFDAFSDYLDVRYSVAHEKVKEDIILERKSGFNSYKVTYNVKEKDALATLNDDGSITFTSPAGAVLFTVGVPVMYDSDGKSSSDIAVSMVQTKKTVEVIYTPSADWLNAEDRVYPVTIDPMSTSSQATSNIEDVSMYYMLYSQDDIFAETPYIRLGMDNTAYIKFHTVPTIPAGEVLSGSSLVFQGSSLIIWDETEPCNVDIGDTTVSWDETTFTYVEGQEYAEYLSVNQNYTLEYLTFNYNDDATNPNYTLEIPLYDFYTDASEYTSFFVSTNGFRVVLNNFYEFTAHSSEYSIESYRPAIVVRYGEDDWDNPEVQEYPNDHGTPVPIDYNKEYRLYNDSTLDYITYTVNNVTMTEYSQDNVAQKVRFGYSSFQNAHSISVTDGNEYLYYCVDSEGALTYSVWTSVSSTTAYESWKIYAFSGYWVIASVADEKYVLTDINGILNVMLYDSTNYAQLWHTELYNSTIIDSIGEDLTLEIGEELLLKPIVPAISYSSDNTAVATVSSDGILNVIGLGYAEIDIVTASQTLTVGINVTLIQSNYHITNKHSGKYAQPNDNHVGVDRHFLEQHDLANSVIQKWSIIYDSYGYYRIRNVDTGLYLTSPSSTATGEKIYEDEYSVALNDRQRWLITPTTSGAYTIKSKYHEDTALVMSLKKNTSDAGANILQENYVADSSYIDEWILTTTTKKAIVIVPGMLGSSLENENGTEVWLTFNLILLPQLYLNEDGTSQEPLTSANYDNYGVGNVYKTLYDSLYESYINNFDILFFDYDFRLSIDIAAQKLVDETSIYDELVIIAHSMGGLVASKGLVISQDHRNKTKALITIGTPFLGTAECINTMETGELLTQYFGPLETHPFNDTIKTVSKNSYSAYQTLPTKYYASITGFNPIKIGNIEYSQVYPELANTEWGKMSDGTTKPMFQAAKDFHNSLFLNGVHITQSNAVKIYMMAGKGIGTTATVNYNSDFTFDSVEPCLFGDGVVLAKSACYGDDDNDNDDNTRVFPGVGHTALVSSDDVIEEIKKLITQETGVTAQDIVS